MLRILKKEEGFQQNHMFLICSLCVYVCVCVCVCVYVYLRVCGLHVKNNVFKRELDKLQFSKICH